MQFGKILIILGFILVTLGILLTFTGKIPFLGKLPGDFRIERNNFSFYFPLASCLLVSLLISLILWFFRR